MHVKFPEAEEFPPDVMLAVVEGVPAAAVTVTDPVEETKELADPEEEAAEEAADEAPVEAAPPPTAEADEAAAWSTQESEVPCWTTTGDP